MAELILPPDPPSPRGPFRPLSRTGTHAAVRVDNGGEGFPSLFDPSGGYQSLDRGSGFFFEGADADLGSYLRYHFGSGDNALVFSFPTTPAKAHEIARRFGYPRAYDPQGLEGADTVSSALVGTGPSKGLKPTAFPGGLANQLRRLLGIPSPCRDPLCGLPPEYYYTGP